MGEWCIQREKVDAVEPHPNADRLDILTVGGYPVIAPRGEYGAGDTVIRVPPDTLLGETWKPLKYYEYTDKGRVRASKLRGVVSHGFVIDDTPDLAAIADIAAALDVSKYEELAPHITFSSRTGARAVAGPKVPKYDVDGWRKYNHLFAGVDQVLVTEKLHGANFRCGWVDGTFYVGSRSLWLDGEGHSSWWAAARFLQLPEKTRALGDGAVLYGELLPTQDLTYGLRQGEWSVRFFDAYTIDTMEWVPVKTAEAAVVGSGMQWVPTLYEGQLPDTAALMDLTIGASTICPEHLREGIVIRAIPEQFAIRDVALNRLVLKLVSDDFLVRGGGK